ncbi:hypothetical protein BGX26_005306, partial [Mortierella sp. AD094]
FILVPLEWIRPVEKVHDVLVQYCLRLRPRLQELVAKYGFEWILPGQEQDFQHRYDVVRFYCKLFQPGFCQGEIIDYLEAIRDGADLASLHAKLSTIHTI